MAGYIEWSKGLAEKREVLVMASCLRRDPIEIAGRLMLFWEWCDDNIPEDCIDQETGDAVIVLSPSRSATIDFIDAKCGLKGVAKCLGNSKIRWLHFLKNGQVLLKNFGRHNGATAKTRARNSRNQAKRRANSVTDLSPFADDKKATTQPNPTQPNIGRVGRSVEESLEGGCRGGEFQSLLKLQDRHLDRPSDLCAIHRALHAEHPDLIPADENALLGVMGAAIRTRRKAKQSPTEFFRGIFRRGKFPTITAQEKSEAGLILEGHRRQIDEARAAGKTVPVATIPLCDEVPV